MKISESTRLSTCLLYTSIAMIVGQFIWGRVADRARSVNSVLMILMFGTVGSSVVFLFATNFYIMLTAIVGYYLSIPVSYTHLGWAKLPLENRKQDAERKPAPGRLCQRECNEYRTGGRLPARRTPPVHMSLFFGFDKKRLRLNPNTADSKQ